MSELNVRIVELEPMHVASAHGFGAEPEAQAWEKLVNYCKKAGLAQNLKAHRFFGFNNPSPTPGSSNYGYEQWITVGPETQAQDDVEIKQFAGGRYAVTHTNLTHITENWNRLVAWCEDSSYRMNHEQCLEEALNYDPDAEFDPEKMEFDLYLAIAR